MSFELNDEVLLESDLPHQGVKAGAIGRIIEVYGPDLFEVDFGEQAATVLASQMSKVPSKSDEAP